MSQCNNCGNCVHWEKSWNNEYEGYCNARVEITDSLFLCKDYGATKDEKPSQAAEASVGGMV